MTLLKSQVIEALRKITSPGEGGNLIDAGVVKNIVIFGDEVVVDATISNPSLQAKKKVEVEIMKAIHAEVYEKAKVKVNIPLRKMGFRVGLLDADIYGPSIPMMFDVQEERPASVEVNGRSKMKPVENYGVKILSIGFFTHPDQAVIWRGPMASKALNQMIFDADWGELDFLLIDLPPGTGDIHLSIMQALPITGAVVVSTPQNVALADARKGIAMFRQETINVPVLGLVENMAYFTPAELPENKYYIFGKEGVKSLAERTDTPLLGEIPLVQSLRESGDVGRPAALQEGTPLAKAFEDFARNTVAEVVTRNQYLAPTEAIQITTMAGCSPKKK